MQEQQLTPDEDQLWRAFLYVSDEFSDDDAEEFERQMMDDELLCEAVVQATRLTSAVAGSQRNSPQVVVAANIIERPVRSSKVAALVAVCCCLGAVLITVQFAATPEPRIGYSEPTEAEQLVDAWADSFSGAVPSETEPSDFSQQELDVPDWMMAAVSLEASGESGSAMDGSDGEADWF